jgi:hypothetical protein
MLAAATYSAPSARPVQVTCNQASAVFLFWPRGHGTIPRADLPAHPAPHVEIYKSHSYSNSNLLGFLNAKGKIRFSGKCDRDTAAAPSGPIPRNDTARRRLAITCELGRYTEIRATPIAGGLRLDFGVRDHREGTANITRKGSSFTYDTQFCRGGPVPH